ncbi:ABC transporter substrate-binding protein [Halobaculum sp. EA56]|uniref:ABC transporter substrate-binding protein n=1 Tax=Halobaculum sp. EA56 TaxID=3421648 RepID=UPI003EBAB495
MTDQSGISRREILYGTVAAGVGLAGCTGSQSGSTETTTGPATTDRKTTASTSSSMPASKLDIAISSTDSFDPIKIKGDGSTKVTQQIYDTLTYLPQGSIEPELQLASDYTVSNGGTRYTFQLKEGVSFHDGSTLTAQDFVYSWERLAASENAQESKIILLGSFQVDHQKDAEGNYEPGSLAVEAVDDYTLQVDLVRPFTDALYNFSYGALAPVPEGIVGDIEGYEGELSYQEFAQQNPIGSGPYQFESFTPGTGVSLSKFSEYHGTGGNVETIDMQILEDPNARFTYALNNNSDVFQVPTSKFTQRKATLTTTKEFGQRVGTYGPLSNGETVNYGTFPTNYTSWFIFNCNRVERPVRRAVNHVANQEVLLSQAFKGLGQPAYHYTPPSVFPGGADAYTAHAKTGANAQTEWGQDGFPYGYRQSQIDAARQVMEDAGYGSDSPYDLTFTIYTDRKPGAYQRIAQILQSKLKPAHIDLTIDKRPFSAIIDGAINNKLDFFTLGNGLAYPSPADSLKFAYPNANNFSRWGKTDGKGEATPATKRAKEAWETVANNFGPSEEAQQKRNEAYLVLEEANWHDAPVMLNYHPVSQQFWYDRVDMTVKTSSFHERQYDQLSISQ